MTPEGDKDDLSSLRSNAFMAASHGAVRHDVVDAPLKELQRQISSLEADVEKRRALKDENVQAVKAVLDAHRTLTQELRRAIETAEYHPKTSILWVQVLYVSAISATFLALAGALVFVRGYASAVAVWIAVATCVCSSGLVSAAAWLRLSSRRAISRTLASLLVDLGRRERRLRQEYKTARHQLNQSIVEGDPSLPQLKRRYHRIAEALERGYAAGTGCRRE